MRKTLLVALASASVVTCTSPADRSASAPSAPSLARVQDLDGMPDLIVNQHKLAHSWVIYEEPFSPTSCTTIEGGFKAGTHRTLRFTVSTPNIGTADVFIGSPLDHVDPNRDGDFSDSDGLSSSPSAIGTSISETTRRTRSSPWTPRGRSPARPSRRKSAASA